MVLLFMSSLFLLPLETRAPRPPPINVKILVTSPLQE